MIRLGSSGLIAPRRTSSSPASGEVRPVSCSSAIRRPVTSWLDREHRSQFGQFAAHDVDLHALRLVLADQHRRAGVADHPGDLLRRARRVDRHDDAARREHGQFRRPSTQDGCSRARRPGHPSSVRRGRTRRPAPASARRPRRSVISRHCAVLLEAPRRSRRPTPAPRGTGGRLSAGWSSPRSSWRLLRSWRLLACGERGSGGNDLHAGAVQHGGARERVDPEVVGEQVDVDARVRARHD